jgi:hypothetical protein
MNRKERRAAEDRADQAMFDRHHERVCARVREEAEAEAWNAPWSEDVNADSSAWDFMEAE